MQTRVNGLTNAGKSSEESWIKNEAGHGLIEEIQPLLAPRGVGPEALTKALNEALLEISNKPMDGSPDDRRELLLGLILWKIFAKGSPLWISLKTAAGNSVPPDLLVAAYAMWRNASYVAARQEVDNAAAAEALVKATHATADRIANGRNSESEEIRDIRKYLFAAYRNAIVTLAGKQGLNRTDYVDMGDWIANRELSDRGAFVEAVESEILCRELLESMPPRGRSVAVARYILGYSWPETAGALDTSVNAAQRR